MTLAPDLAPSSRSLTLGRVVVLIRDYDEALAFYRSAFGASVLFDAPSPNGDRYLHLGFGPDASAGVWLLRATGEATARVGRQTGGEPLAVFYTSDLRAAVARAAAGGAEIVRPVESADGASFAHVTDLYGNVFVLVELSSAAA
ncbi:MAG TPA: VOC family protein [Gemmatimonadaceae bacterium]|jgi:predicted enzyme related to lactoylglutathione lyase|nr:VOC family protein [Gemmatimonadaceae bacterium]